MVIENLTQNRYYKATLCPIMPSMGTKCQVLTRSGTKCENAITYPIWTTYDTKLVIKSAIVSSKIQDCNITGIKFCFWFPSSEECQLHSPPPLHPVGYKMLPRNRSQSSKKNNANFK